jgi:hypothetical protein
MHGNPKTVSYTDIARMYCSIHFSKSMSGLYSLFSHIDDLSTIRYKSLGDTTICPTSRVHGEIESFAVARVSLVNIELRGIDANTPLS